MKQISENLKQKKRFYFLVLSPVVEFFALLKNSFVFVFDKMRRAKTKTKIETSATPIKTVLVRKSKK